MLNMDIQGAELLALKGAKNCLKYFDVIYTEINIKEMYQGCALVGEINKFLEEYGFVRDMEDEITDNVGWCDAMYFRKK